MIDENIIKICDVTYSQDQVCKKYVQATSDNFRIETSYVDYKNKYIICFSTQVGCNLGCKFCYNGIKHNFKRNLTDKEIYNQIKNVIDKEKTKNDKPILFSAMGIGEPLLNYDNLISAFHILNKKYPNSKFALATTGIDIDKIAKLPNDLKDIKKFKLTISIHSADQSKRKKIMPISNNLNVLIDAVKKYEKVSGREVEWNYVLFDGVNDSTEDAIKLFKVLGKDQYIKINKFNKVDISNLKESKNVKKFMNDLNALGMKAEYYETNGADINAACGQMIS